MMVRLPALIVLLELSAFFLFPQELQEPTPQLPSEYREIWETQKIYDTVQYKLLQLGIGIKPGDRFIIPVETDLYEYPPMTDSKGLVIAMFYSLYSHESRALFGRDSGLIVALFAGFSVDDVDQDTVKGYLLGEYLGHCKALNAPLFKTDYLMLEDAGSEVIRCDFGETVLDEKVLKAVETVIKQGD
jgi:hypothetical protein